MTRKKSNKSDLILTAAKKVFADEGYHSTSVSRIAKEAGVGDGTIYLYFQNKEDILIKLFHTAIYHQFVPRAETIIEHMHDPRMMLYELIRNHLDFFGNDYELARVIQIESRQSNANIRESRLEGVRRYFQLIETTITKGQGQGIFRNDISARTIRKVIFGSLDEVVTCWVLSNKKYLLITKVEEVYKLLLQSVYDFSQLGQFPLVSPVRQVEPFNNKGTIDSK
ncbi:TetR/AcrR family transcriptional regulator [Bacillus sp. FJAT-45350]|uniref:TetR/AcrR family transcriptional regulator n=1 Tax=Bacillus sp. FJAT-45350 TaxID=2011014 RepID=UPI000BB9841B|nr:TetR/AcrR family transcriptional regulator [Bacillus sp. FJAT-45350]